MRFTLHPLADLFTLHPLADLFSLHPLADLFTLHTLAYLFTLHPLVDPFTLHPLSDLFTLHPLSDLFTLHPLADLFTLHPLADLFTLHPLADLFIPTSSQLLWEALSSAAITARRLFVHIYTSVCSQVLIYTAEWTVTMWGERNCQSFETAAWGFEPEFSRLRADLGQIHCVSVSFVSRYIFRSICICI